MANQFSTMSMNEFYRVWGPQIDEMTRKIGTKVNYDFSLKGSELTDDAVARAWIAMPKMLEEYDPSICPLMPYLGQRINWLLLSEKRKNAKRGQHEILPSENSEGFTNSLESDVDYEDFIKAERRDYIREALARLEKKMPAGKHRKCLQAHIAQLENEDMDLAKILTCSRQHVHNLKKAIPNQVDPQLAAEIREMLRRDDTATTYAVKTSAKTMYS